MVLQGERSSHSTLNVPGGLPPRQTLTGNINSVCAVTQFVVAELGVKSMGKGTGKKLLGCKN